MQVLVVGGVVVVAAAIALAAYRAATKDPNEGVQFFTVARGPLTIDVTLSGAVQNRDQVIVKNEVEGRTTILWIAPEGNQIQEGDLLVELDSAQMSDRLKQQEITVINANAAFIAARENLDITKSQGQSDFKKAELDLDFARMDLEKYEQGDYKQMHQQAESDKTLADQTLKKADDQVSWSRRLNREGYITATELQSDELTAKKALLDSNLSEVKLWLLEKYTYDRNLKQYQSNVEQAAMALDRVRKKAAADDIQADASLKAKDSEFKRQTELRDKIQDQIAKCTVRAPVAGMVVYSSTGKMNRWGGSDQPLQEGREVFERQELIYLPTTSSMMAEVKLPESSLRKIRTGLPARITVDAVPGKTYHGSVAKIGLLPDAQAMWMNPDLKVYTTQIFLEEEGVELRAGMGCRAEIIVEEYDHELYLPVQAVIRAADHYAAFVLGPRGPEERTVEVGLDNNRMVRLLSGLREGEKVMQTPPLSSTGQPTAASNGGPTTRSASTSQPAGAEATSQPGAGLLRASDLQRMTPEERQKYLDGLTPEQRQELANRRPRRQGAAPTGDGSDAPRGGRGGRGGGGGGGGGRGGGGGPRGALPGGP